VIRPNPVRPDAAQLLQEHLDVVRTFLAADVHLLRQVADLVRNTLESGNKLLLCGNGGSAADSQHIAAEFVGRFAFDRRPVPALALTVDTSAITAIGNDYGFEHIFSRQLEALGAPNDVLFALSTSGNSKNVVAAAKRAREKGIHVVGFTGHGGGQLLELCDFLVAAPSSSTPRIQEIHGLAMHIIAELAEWDLLGPEAAQ
jgi:D-sedoheptulose 7-phosphate isomerase